MLKKNFILNSDVEKLVVKFNDSTDIEYLFQNINSQDSFWQSFPKGAAALHLPVQANNNYNLFLRYKFQPESVNYYTIKIKPHWWQTIIFKIIALLIFIVCIVLLLFNYYRKKKKEQLEKKENENKQTRLELKSIRSQLNPHFIFNALNSIQALINKNEINAANHYLTKFSNLLRESLKNNDKEFIPLQIELQTLEDYIKIEQLRFQFKYKITVDENINTEITEIPSLLLQPLIENAVKHGISALKDAGEININFQSSNKNLLINIIDNGKGFNTKNETTGFGLKLTKDRIQLLNQSLQQQNIKISINSKTGKGTEVYLTFENWL